MSSSVTSRRVALEGHDESSVLHVTGCVVTSNLQLIGFESERPIDRIKFGSVYYGSDSTQSALLYNNGPEPVRFVVILNDSAEGQLVVALFACLIGSRFAHDIIFIRHIFVVKYPCLLEAFVVCCPFSCEQ